MGKEWTDYIRRHAHKALLAATAEMMDNSFEEQRKFHPIYNLAGPVETPLTEDNDDQRR